MAQAAPIATGVNRSPWNRDPSVVRTDQQLLQQFLSGPGESAEAAFIALVERYGAIVRRVCIDVLGCSHEGQDAAQAVFLVLARKARSIRKPESLGPWLHGVAIRVARRAKSEAARRRAAEHRKAEMTREHDFDESGPDIMDHVELHAEIDRLPEKYRQPIILCYLQGQTQPQAAQTLGWPLGTVQIRLHRGRERLRSRLTRRGAGVLALPGSDWMTRLSVTPDNVAHAWNETTARAAIRFAAGKGTTGLVAAPVTRLAESVLAAMLADSLKVVTLTVISLLCVLAGVDAARRYVSHLEPEPVRVATREPRQAPSPPVLVPSDRTVDKNDSAPVPTVPMKEKATIAERVQLSPERTTSVTSPSNDQVEKGVVRPATAASPGRSLGPALVGRPSEQTQRLGRELFERVWVKNDPRSHGGDGLGPVFNGQSCVACHNLGGSGGAGAFDRNIEIATSTGSLGEGMGYFYAFSMDFGAGRFEYRMGGDPQGTPRRQTQAEATFLAGIHPGLKDSKSTVLHHFGTDPLYHAWRGSVPGRHGSFMIQSSERNPFALFGAGRIDAIPDEAIEAAARRRSSSSAQVKGRVSRLKDGRVGRFGWKAQTATLEEFVRSAAAGEIGLEVPGRHQAADPRTPGLAAKGLDMDEGECDALVAYVRSLPVPVAIKRADDKDSAQWRAGEATFRSIGCTACHMPKLGDVEGIYSDLLLHDMGPQLSDADTYSVFVSEPGQADGVPVADHSRTDNGPGTVREWRTPPLWGIRDSGPYLHDGRAATIAQAIMLHAGQGAAAARRYAELSPRRKQQIDAFLLSLAAPMADR
jgi:RNA polymerase sigma factor (sigma-70 family)